MIRPPLHALQGFVTTARLGNLRHRAVGRRRVAIHDGDRGAAPGEEPRDCRADSRSGPGDERGFSLKVEHSRRANIPYLSGKVKAISVYFTAKVWCTVSSGFRFI